MTRHFTHNTSRTWKQLLSKMRQIYYNKSRKHVYTQDSVSYKLFQITTHNQKNGNKKYSKHNKASVTVNQ